MCKLLCLNSLGPFYLLNKQQLPYLSYGSLNILKMHGTEVF